MIRLVFVVLILGLAGGVEGEPSQGEQPLTLSAHTDLVTLAVTVLDRTAVPVRGLRREHFSVYDNGELQEIQFFTDEALPATLGLVLDGSGSMRGREAYATAAIDAFTAVVQPLDQFFTLHFNEAVWPGLGPGIAFTNDADVLHRAGSAISARGMTAVYDAIERGLEHLQRGTRDRRALIVISDGGDNASVHELEDVVAHAREIGVAIFSVTLADVDGRDANAGALKALTRKTGGRAVAVKRVSDVPRVFTQIAQELRAGYVIGFLQPENATAGFRSIRVVVDAGDGRRLVARTRTGYHAVAAGHSPR
jgi:Ca-activated chloride channel family protein